MPSACLAVTVAQLRITGGQRHVVQQAEAHRRVCVCMVAGRAYQRKALGGAAAPGSRNSVHHSKRRANSLHRMEETDGSHLVKVTVVFWESASVAIVSS